MLVLGCGFQQNWNGCFPSGSEQLSETTNASIQQQESGFVVHAYLCCARVTSELPLCWEAAFLLANGCSCKGTYNLCSGLQTIACIALGH